MSMICFANDFAEKKEILRLHCISHKTIHDAKSDAFLFEYAGTLFLIDGGMPEATFVYEYLLNLRREWLKDHPELMEDESCKLRLSWIVSHFHTDHVGAMINTLIHSPYLTFDHFYYSPDTDIFEEFQDPTLDGDEKLRPLLREALAKNPHQQPEIHQLAFGKENSFTVTTESGLAHEMSIRFMPPVMDHGVEWYMRYIEPLYAGPKHKNWRMTVGAVNNASVWTLFTLGDRKFLFTGDTMKREACLHSEGLEYMLEAYKDEIGTPDVMKFIHHGFARDNALPAMMDFAPQYLIVSKADSPIPEMVKEQYPDTTTKVVNIVDRTLVFTCGFDESGNELPLTAEWTCEG